MKWLGQTRRKLAIIKDTEANLVANTLFNLYNNTNPISTEASPSGNKDMMAQLKLEHPTIWAAINGIKDTLIIKLDEKSSVDESKLAKIEAELCKVRADYNCETEKLNAKYSELSLEHESTKFVLESRLKEAEFKLKEAKSEVGNLKENIQGLKYDNNFLLDILQSNESIWSKPKRTCPSKSVLDRAELSILNTFGPLEADETNVVEKATCNEVGPCCSTNRDELVVIENETTNSAVDVTQSETEPQANVSPSGEIQDNNQSINPEKMTNSAVDVTQSETEPQANVSPSGEIQGNNQSINPANSGLNTYFSI